MLYKIITSFLFSSLLLFSARAQKPTLATKQVVEKFYSTYDISSLPYPRVELEKKKGNWYIKTIGFEEGKPVRSAPRLFYSAKTRSFIELDFPRTTTAVAIDYLDYIPEYESYNFDLQPFYGYAGWYKDVIKEYNSTKTLSDEQLYALGRAYSSQAASPITNQAGDALPADIYHLSFGTDAFSAKQLAQFSVSVDSGIAKFRQLSIRNPGFPTRVGDIRDKYANELLFKFHILLTFSEQAAMQMTIPASIYKDSTLQVAREWLAGCPPGAIFVSFGDNDFYPVLYLQKNEGFRRDVHVINYNLLGIDKYIYRATQPQFDAPGVRLSADTSLYKDSENEYIRRTEARGSVSVTQLLDSLENNLYSTDGFFTLAADAIRIDRNKEEIVGTVPVISLKDATYLLKNHWVLLDIINNLNRRPICFPNKFSDQLKGLNEYLTAKNGLFIYQ